MQSNVGNTDKIIRLAVGVAIVGIGAIYQSWWGIIGLAPIITALVGWCPGYAVIGTSTCKMPEQKQV